MLVRTRAFDVLGVRVSAITPGGLPPPMKRGSASAMTPWRDSAAIRRHRP
jgi:hypothetical protein